MKWIKFCQTWEGISYPRNMGWRLTNSWRYVRKGSSHELCSTGDPRIPGSLLYSLEEKYKRRVMEGQKNRKVSSSQLYVCVEGCDELGEASWRRWHLNIHYAISHFRRGWCYCWVQPILILMSGVTTEIVDIDKRPWNVSSKLSGIFSFCGYILL